MGKIGKTGETGEEFDLFRGRIPPLNGTELKFSNNQAPILKGAVSGDQKGQ
jgi:hypothetical protein